MAFYISPTLLICRAILILLIGCQSSFGQSDSMRQTTTGPILGFREEVLTKHVDFFYGIPYAKPPVGPLRFKPPEAIDSWSETLNSTKQPNSCVQVSTALNTLASEDCLYLNIWQPVGGAEKKAVMIYIYGGIFAFGSITSDLVNGKQIAAEGDVIVMSMQYRLGIFGFGYLQNGHDSSDGYLDGNMGLQDQAMAIKWFYDNVEVFGGDKDRITLFGQSAGAASTCYQFQAEENNDIISGILLQSGTGLATFAYNSPMAATIKTLTFAALSGCYNGDIPTDSSGTKLEYDKETIVNCLLNADANVLALSQYDFSGEKPRMRFIISPTLDDRFITERPSVESFTRASHGRPVVGGIVSNEGYLVLLDSFPQLFPRNDENPPPLSEDIYKQILAQLPGGDNALLRAAVTFEYGTPYEHSTEPTNYRVALDRVIADGEFACPLSALLQGYAAMNEGEAFAYIYGHKLSVSNYPDYMGSVHGYELSIVFGLPLVLDGIYTEEEKILSRNIIRYWTNFAKNKDPNINDDGSQTDDEWHHYDIEDRSWLYINSTELTTINEYNERKCSFWNELAPMIMQADSQQQNCTNDSGDSDGHKTTVNPIDNSTGTTSTTNNLSGNDFLPILFLIIIASILLALFVAFCLLLFRPAAAKSLPVLTPNIS